MKNSKFISITCLLATFVIALFLASCGPGPSGDVGQEPTPL